MKKTIILLLSFVALVSCNTFSDVGKVLRNEKTNTTDEFLVKKKQPLVLPPDFEKLPTPDSIDNKEINENEKIKKILKAPKELNKASGKSSLEESVLNKIRK